ncbi:MAG: ABC transporter ATP-binding protein [Planctomycetes bacterium]|nr:ABC transporter ATP-binding protein [Planctomycetota bacterium]MCW8136792.1 ABC transporter ATP-binding protein [Planctomycetota bacterium]
MSEPLITLDHASKRFARGYHVKTLAELLFTLPRRLAQQRKDGLREHEFWALRDVTLDVSSGETLGVIGANGAGKSTILKLLFNILRPDRGHVRVRGRVGGLIELGAGFHPYLTGRENVFINGSILGLKQREVRARYDSIVEFAGLSEFMDMPVKNYSSGMFARLAFAVAAHADTDVLLVDEVLAVGDTSFQLKCFDWIARKRKQGGAVVIVSHEMNNIRGCDRALYLSDGRMVALGEPLEVINRYLAESGASRDPRADDVGFVAGDDGKPIAEITSVEWLAGGQPVACVTPGQAVSVRFGYEARSRVQDPVFALTLFHDDPRFSLTSKGYLVHLWSSDAFAGRTLEGAGAVEVELEALHLPAGQYRCKAYLFEGGRLNPLYVRDGIARIECTRPDWSDERGLVDVRQRWSALAPAEKTT